MKRSVTVLALLAMLPGPTAAESSTWQSPLALGPSDATSIAARPGLLLAGGRKLQDVEFGGKVVTIPGPARAGIFVSEDRGRTWSLGEELVTGEDGEKLRVPIERTPDVLAVSEAASFAAFGAEVWRSDEDGSTWSNVGRLPSPASTLDVLPGGRIAAGLAAGRLSISEDLGATWTAAGAGLPSSRMNDLLAVSGSILLAATDAGVFRSTDGGLTFTRSARGLTDDDATVRGLAGTASSGIFLGTVPVSTTLVYWSPDLGQTWIGRGPIYSENAIATLSPGALDLVEHNATAGEPGLSLFAGAHQGLFRSSVALTTGDRNLSAPGLVWTRHDPEPGAATIGDVAVEIDRAPGAPGDIAYVAVKTASVFVTGAVQGHWTAPGWYSQLHWGRICGGLDPQPNGVIVAACGGHIMRSTDRGATWQPAGKGLVYSNLGSPDKPWGPLVQAADGSMFTGGTDTGMFRADPLVRQWTKVATFPGASVAAIGAHPTDAKRLYAAWKVVYHSRDGGETWIPHPELGRYTYAIATTRLRPDRVLVADFEGGSMSEDAGETWMPVVLPPGEIGFINAEFSPLDADVAWGRTRSDRLIRSIDGGRTWSIARDEKLVGILGVHPSPWSADTLYFETFTQGIHVSRDGGKTIEPLADGLPKLGAQFSYPLEFSPDEPGVMYVSTGASVGQSYSPLYMWIYRGVDRVIAG